MADGLAARAVRPLITAVHGRYRWRAYSPSQERRPRVLVEQVGVTDVSTQSVEALVP
jgi:hypothetical protein